MTATHLHGPHGGSRRVSRGWLRAAASRFVGTAAAAVRDWRRRARARSELAALDDRTLHDIGISRSDALYLGSKAADRDTTDRDSRDSWATALRFPPF